jgi:hypothetical protein
MLLSVMYLMIRMLLRLLVPDGQGEAAKDLEIVVLEEALLPGSIDFGNLLRSPIHHGVAGDTVGAARSAPRPLAGFGPPTAGPTPRSGSCRTISCGGHPTSRDGSKISMVACRFRGPPFVLWARISQ